MSIALVYDCFREARRLATAGSSLAADDFRLRRLVEPLEKAGAKSPVFGKLASAVSRVVDGEEAGSGVALLELGTLAGAILYTQGKTGAEGELEAPSGEPVSVVVTDTSARVLAPLVEALTTTGSGRMEIVADAHGRGAFQDFRLVRPAVGALDDVYPELADYIGNRVLPEYGERIVPLLEEGLNYKGGRRDARRLMVIHRISPEKGRAIAEEILDEGSKTEGNKEMKIAAIQCLAGSKEHLSELLGLSKAKNKEVRRAAFQAMAKTPVRSVVARFKEAIMGADAGLVADVSAEVGDAELSKTMTEEAVQLWAELKAKKPNLSRLRILVKGLDPASDAEADALFEDMVRERAVLVKVKNKSGAGGEDLFEEVSGMILKSGAPSGRRLLDEIGEDIPDLGFYFFAELALRHWDVKRFYKVFSPMVATKVKKGTKAGQRRDQTMWVLAEAAEERRELDPRWFTLAVKSGEPDLALELLEGRKIGRAETKFLEELADGDEESLAVDAIKRLAGEGSKKVVGMLGKLVSGKAYNIRWHVANVISRLPGAYFKEVEKWVSGLEDKDGDHLLEALEELRKSAEKS